MASTDLTIEERETLNAAEQIVKAHFNCETESMLLSFHAGWEGISICYFTPNRVQHGSLWQLDGDNSFAGKLAYALSLRADEDGRADQIKAQRVENLKAELASLTGEPSIAQAA